MIFKVNGLALTAAVLVLGACGGNNQAPAGESGPASSPSNTINNSSPTGQSSSVINTTSSSAKQVDTEEEMFLSAPRNIKYLRTGTSEIQLTWQHASTPESNPAAKTKTHQATRFEVYRNNTLIGSVANTEHQFTDTAIVQDERYQYYIVAIYDELTPSSPSTASTIVTVDNTLTALPQVANSSRQLHLSIDNQYNQPLFNIDLIDGAAENVTFHLAGNNDFSIDAVGQIYLQRSIDLKNMPYSTLDVMVRNNSVQNRYVIELIIDLTDDFEGSTVIGEENTSEDAALLSQLSANNAADHIALHWQSALPEANYLVYRNGILMGTTEQTTFLDSQARNQQFYTYSIQAFVDTGVVPNTSIETSIISNTQFSQSIITTSFIQVSVSDNYQPADNLFDLKALLINDVAPESVTVEAQGDNVIIDPTTLMLSLNIDGKSLNRAHSATASFNSQGREQRLNIHFTTLTPDQLNQRGANLEFFSNLNSDKIQAINSNRTANIVNTTPNLATETNVANNYGQRLTGYYLASYTGSHQFYLSSDDHSQFWLSTDVTSSNAQLVSELVGYSVPNDYRGSLKTVDLIAGQYYYFKALHVEIGGGDHLSVGVIAPSSMDITPIIQRDIMLRTTIESLVPSINLSAEQLVQLTLHSGPLKPTERLSLVYGRYNGQLNAEHWEHQRDITQDINNGTLEFDITDFNGVASGGESDLYITLLKHTLYKTEQSNTLIIPRL